MRVLQRFPPSTDHEDSHLFCPLLSSHIPGSPIFVSLAHASTASLLMVPLNYLVRREREDSKGLRETDPGNGKAHEPHI